MHNQVQTTSLPTGRAYQAYQGVFRLLDALRGKCLSHVDPTELAMTRSSLARFLNLAELTPQMTADLLTSDLSQHHLVRDFRRDLKQVHRQLDPQGEYWPPKMPELSGCSGRSGCHRPGRRNNA